MGDDTKTEFHWFVYMLHCDDGSLYTGITTDLTRRLVEHNDNKLGARYTRARRPVKLAWFERCETRSHASVREAEIKKLDRNQKKLLIALSWKKYKSAFRKAGADQTVLGNL